MRVEENKHHKSNDYKKCAVEHYRLSALDDTLHLDKHKKKLVKFLSVP